MRDRFSALLAQPDVSMPALVAQLDALLQVRPQPAAELTGAKHAQSGGGAHHCLHVDHSGGQPQPRQPPAAAAVAAQMQQERLCSVLQLHAAGPHASW